MKTLTKGLIATMILGGATLLFAQSMTNSNTEITMQQAKEIALNKAGFSENEVKWLDIEYDKDFDKNEYEIEFKKDKMEYEYEIDAKTGEITSIKIEKNHGFFN